METSKSLSDSMAYNDQLRLLGISIGNYDYNEATGKLETIAKYNVWLSAAIRAIVSNSIKPTLKLWNPATKEDADNYEMMKPILEPNPLLSYSDLLRNIVFSRLFYGNAYLVKLRAGNKVIGLLPLKSAYVTPKWTEDRNDKYFEYAANGQVIRLPKEDVIHFRDNDYGDSLLKGAPIIEHVLFAITSANNADRFNIKTIENGGGVKIALKTTAPKTPDQKKQMADAWRDANGGADNGGKIAILDNAEVINIGQSVKEMDFANLKNVSRDEIIAVMKVPSVELSLQTQNYATANNERRLFWETRMIPLLDDIAYTFTAQLLRPDMNASYEYYYDYSTIPAMQEDMQKKIATAQGMLYLGYDLATIAQTLDLPEPTATPVTEETQPAQVVNGFFVKSGAVTKAYRDSLKNSFIKAHTKEEKRIDKTVTGFFLDQRNEILDELERLTGQKDLTDITQSLLKFVQNNGNTWKDQLKEKMIKEFLSVSDGMVRDYMNEFNLAYRKTIAQTVIIGNHANNITGVQDTAAKGYENKIKTVLANTLAEGGNVSDLRKNIEAETRAYYKNMSTHRAQTIARTEITSVANDLIKNQFVENGVTKKEWLTAEDESVRSFSNGAEFDHVAMDGVKVDVQNTFEVPASSGVSEMIDYPGDMSGGSAGNVINCRCAMIPD